MIEFVYFHDEEHEAWNGYAVDTPNVNATSGAQAPSIPGSFEQLGVLLVESWNRQHPGDPITVDDLAFTETDPYRSPHGDDGLTEEDMIEGTTWSPVDPEMEPGRPVPVEEYRRPG